MIADPHAVPRIVAGVDMSDGSKAALRWAARIAAGLGAELDVVVAWQIPIVLASWDPKVDTLTALKGVVRDILGDSPAPGLRVLEREGSASHVLIECSKDALMVVVGSRGRGGFTGLTLGSVSAAVAEHASCPVLVVHGDQPPPVRVA